MDKLIKLQRCTDVRGDETAVYKVEMLRPFTVSEFIDYILTVESGEWGYIGIKDKNNSIFGSPKCEYRWGKLSSSLPNDILHKQVVSLYSNGGWSRMDYVLTLKEE